MATNNAINKDFGILPVFIKINILYLTSIVNNLFCDTGHMNSLELIQNTKKYQQFCDQFDVIGFRNEESFHVNYGA